MLGIFDSGVGGLTVWREIKALSPQTPLLYYADTKNAPYGPLSKKTLLEHAKNATSFLVDQGATEIAVACHTISTNCHQELRDHFSLPFYFVSSAALTVLDPYARIGVIGTKATVRSHYYQELLKERLALISPCSPFAPMIEEGKIDLPTLQRYLKKFKSVDALFLACTHYPLIKDQISLLLPGIPLIDPAKAFAASIPLTPSPGKDRFFSINAAQNTSF